MGENLSESGKIIEGGTENHLMKKKMKPEDLYMVRKKYTINHPPKNYPLRTFNLLLPHLLTYFFL